MAADDRKAAVRTSPSGTSHCISLFAEFVPASALTQDDIAALAKSSNRNKEAPTDEKRTRDVLNVSTGEDAGPDVWFLGSGCTYHMCTNRSWFCKYEDSSEGWVRLANGDLCKIAGIGDIKIKMFDGVVRTLADVRYVPDYKHNVISIGTLMDKGYAMAGGGGFLELKKGSKIVVKGERSPENLYSLIGSTVTGAGGASI